MSHFVFHLIDRHISQSALNLHYFFFSYTLKEDSLIQSFKFELTSTPLGQKTFEILLDRNRRWEIGPNQLQKRSLVGYRMGYHQLLVLNFFAYMREKRECARRVHFLVTIFNIYHIILYIIKIRLKHRVYAKWQHQIEEILLDF